jgi:hypothetical protein
LFVPTTAKANRSFKANVNSETSRNYRVETSIKLRKDKQNENLKKRRNRMNAGSPDKVNPGHALPFPQKISEARVQLVCVIESAKAGTCSVAIAKAAIHSTMLIRKVLTGRDATESVTLHAATEVVNSGLLSLFLTAANVPEGDRESTTHGELCQLKFEIAWCINNLAANGKEVDILGYAGSLDTLKELVYSPYSITRDQAIWAVGNLAGGAAEYRDVIWEHPKLLQGITVNLSKPFCISHLINTVWCISNLMQSSSKSSVEQMDVWVIGLMSWLSADLEGSPSEKKELTLELLHALRHTMSSHRIMIQNILDKGFIDLGLQIISKWKDKSSKITGLVIRCLGIICGEVNVANCELLLNDGFLLMIESSDSYVRKEMCYVLGKIADGGENWVGEMLSKSKKNLVAAVIKMVLRESRDVKEEAYWWIANVLCEGKLHRDVSAFCSDMQAFQVLSDCLKNPPDVDLVLRLMDGLENVFKLDLETNCAMSLRDRFVEEQGLQNLEELQQHSNGKVYEKALYLLDTYFETENEDAEDEDIAPLCTEDSFGFGMGKTELFPASAKPFAFVEMENL